MNTWGLQSSEEVIVQVCQHYWMIDTPDGPTSIGTCQRCGSHKEFYNILETPDFWDQTPANPPPLSERELVLPTPEDPAANDG